MSIGKIRLPANMMVKNFTIGKDQTAIALGIERTNTIHGLFVRGRFP